MTIDELIDGWQGAWSGKDPAAFAEVCAAIALAGELSIAGALAAGEFSMAHQRLARGRRKSTPVSHAPPAPK